LEELLTSRGVCVCKSSSSLPLSFHGIRAWCRLRAEQQAQKAKEAVLQQEVIISSPFVFATTLVSELFGRHRQTTSDRGVVFTKVLGAEKHRRFRSMLGVMELELSLRGSVEMSSSITADTHDVPQ
jgi:hypothetical protein